LKRIYFLARVLGCPGTLKKENVPILHQIDRGMGISFQKGKPFLANG
jgi:hypothetical protein